MRLGRNTKPKQHMDTKIDWQVLAFRISSTYQKNDIVGFLNAMHDLIEAQKQEEKLRQATKATVPAISKYDIVPCDATSETVWLVYPSGRREFYQLDSSGAWELELDNEQPATPEELQFAEFLTNIQIEEFWMQVYDKK